MAIIGGKYRARRNRRTGAVSKPMLVRLPGPKRKPQRGNALVRLIKSVAKGVGETKQVSWYNGPVPSNGTYAQANFINQNAIITTNATDILRLIPYVAQGTSDNQRIGERINPVSLTLQGTVCLPTNSFADPTGSLFNDEYVVIFILQHVTLKSYTALQASNDFTQLLRTGENTTVAFQGHTWDAQLPVEDAYYRLLTKRKFRIRNMGVKPASGGGDPNNTWVAPALSPYRAEFKINLSKYLPKVFKYPENPSAPGGNDPTNSSIFMCMGMYRGDATVGQSDTIQQQYVTHLKYKDI